MNTIHFLNLPEFTRHYLIAALWTWDEDAPSGEYTESGRIEDLAPDLLRALRLIQSDAAMTIEEARELADETLAKIGGAA